MNKKIYTALLLAPLLFTACNKQPVTTEALTQEVVTTNATTEIKEAIPQVVKKMATEINGVRFIDKPIVEEEGLVHIDGFIGSIKPTLEDATKSDKTHMTAMGVCSTMAMEMTNSYNAQLSNVKIRRTALKYRNEKNKPDATDISVMQTLKERADFKPVVIEMNDHYRVYKPLPAKIECLVCHGDVSQIPPKVMEGIKRDYPKDLATGYSQGEFKGAIIAEILK